jgi:coenzyme F420-reducing hydrogenase alpha subunit
MHVKIRGTEVSDVRLEIFEPPRFFEAFLRGRAFTEAPDLTARICGICPIAYQMSACNAMEDALGVSIPTPIQDLRRLLYCGEWIESHALHVHMLHAPDFLGYESAVHMAQDHAAEVQRGLDIKKAGNALVEVLGGRSVHPVNVRVGGFYRAPARHELEALTDQLERARDACLDTVRWVGAFEFPAFERDYEFIALGHPDEYPMNQGRLVSNDGLDIAVADFGEHIREQHVPHSTALHAALIERGPYFVGPLARYNLNFDRLSPLAQEAATDAGLAERCRNPFQSIVVRSVETLYACDEALRLIAAYEPPDRPFVEVEPSAATGHGCTEAPRGILYHRYEIDAGGSILDAQIVPPTSQNQPTIEQDLRQYVTDRLELPDEQLQWQCEQAIRNYDPCISCSTHFLRLHIDRE